MCLLSYLSRLLDSFLQFLGEMVSLEELTMTIYFRNSQSGTADIFAQVMRCVQPSSLQKCGISVKFLENYNRRDGLLNIISGEAMQQCLQNWPSIPEFIINLTDNNDAAFGKGWWTTEIIKNLPALKDMLTVNVFIDGMSIASSIEGQCTEHILDGYEAGAKDLWAIDSGLPADTASFM